MNCKHCKWTLLNIFLFMVLFMVLLLMPQNVFCFSVTAQVDRNRISIDDSIVLKVVFEDGKGEVDISVLTDFRIISRSSSSNISIVNGKYSKSLTVIYRLVPVKQGQLLIPPLKVLHEKKIYATRPIVVDVLAANVKPKTSRDIFMEAGLSAASLFTGQQAVYQLKLYSAVRFSNARLQQPSFTGFTAKEAGERKNYQKSINGRVYNVIAINYVIIPEAAGEFKIEPAVISCDVAVKGRRDPFGDSFFSNNFFSFGRSETRRFSTDSLSIKVDPLPPYTGGAVPFSGVVGKFDINAELDRDELEVGESATLTVTLSGQGNIMDAQAPEIIFPSDFKIYDDSPVEEIELTIEGYAGKKVFKKAIVPVRQGSYTIEPVEFSFFNVINRQYEVVSTAPMTLEVVPSALPETAEMIPDPGSLNNDNFACDADGKPLKKELNKKRVEFTGKDILALKEGSEVLVNKRQLPVYLFTILFFLPCVLFYLLKMFLFFGNKEISVSTVLQKKAKDALAAAEKKIHSQSSNYSRSSSYSQSSNYSQSQNQSQSPDGSEDFYKFLQSALVAKIFSRGGVKGESLTSDEVRDILASSGYDSEVSDQANAILNDIESARYGKQENDPAYRQELFLRTRKIFQIFGVLLVCFSILFTVFPQVSIAQSVQLNQSGQSVQSNQSGQSVQSNQSGQSVQSNQSGQSVQSNQSEKSDQSNQSGQSVQSNQSEQSVQSNQSEKSDQSNQFGKYGQSIQAGDVQESYFIERNYFFEGIDAYYKGRYEDASEKFTAIAQIGIHNPSLYYNIGNACLKAGKVGSAVLWYERAKKDIPFDPDLKFNLEYANSFVKDKVENSGLDLSVLLFFWKDYLPTEFLKYGAIAFSFMFFTYAAMRTIRGKRIFTLAGGIFFTVWILLGTTAFYAFYHNTAKNQAVVIVPEAAVRSGTSPDATQLFILHAGSKVKVREIREGYLKIFFSKGKIGWMSSGDAEVI